MADLIPIKYKIMNKLLIALCFLFIGCKGNTQEKEVTQPKASTKTEQYKVTKTEAQWRKQLSDMQFYVLREAGTETAGSSELLHNKEKGVYVCAGCGTELFKSEHKYDSGTGWPSFDREIKGNVAFETDNILGMKRTEEHCAVCGGHLGHVFNDGPRKTTGERHCINGAALKFVPEN